MFCRAVEQEIAASECESIQSEQGEQSCEECPFYLPFEWFMMEQEKK